MTSLPGREANMLRLSRERVKGTQAAVHRDCALAFRTAPGKGRNSMTIAIVGGGICGLSLALNLHARGIAARVFEVAPELKELGVGITLLPHAMREFTALGLDDELLAAGIENAESCFFNRFGQLIYKEPRGKAAGYQTPEVGIHRGTLHRALYRAVQERIGPDCVVTNRLCVGVEQDEARVRLQFKETTSGQALPPVAADIAIACDGVNSALRQQLVGDSVVFTSGQTLPPVEAGMAAPG